MGEGFIQYIIGVFFGIIILATLQYIYARPITMSQIGRAMEMCEPNAGLKEIVRKTTVVCVNGAKFDFPENRDG